MQARFPSAMASYWVASSFRRKSPALISSPSWTPILMIRPGTWALMLTFFLGLISPEAEIMEVRSWRVTFSARTRNGFSPLEFIEER